MAMFMVADAFNICAHCRGTGILVTNGEPCPHCEADGLLRSGTVNIEELENKINDMDDKINDITDKLDDIWEKLNE